MMLASWSPRRGGTAVAWLILISHSSAWVSYSTSTTCRDGLTTLLFDPCGRGSAHDCENVGIVPATTAHCSTTEADGLVVRRRRMMIALLPSIAMASFVPSTAVGRSASRAKRFSTPGCSSTLQFRHRKLGTMQRKSLTILCWTKTTSSEHLDHVRIRIHHEIE